MCTLYTVQYIRLILCKNHKRKFNNVQNIFVVAEALTRCRTPSSVNNAHDSNVIITHIIMITSCSLRKFSISAVTRSSYWMSISRLRTRLCRNNSFFREDDIQRRCCRENGKKPNEFLCQKDQGHSSKER